MQITETRKNNVVELVLSGRLDVNAAEKLEEELEHNLSLGAIKLVVLDMQALEYISSAGVRVLLSAQKNMREGREMIIRSPSKFCRQVFEVTGADIFLKIL